MLNVFDHVEIGKRPRREGDWVTVDLDGMFPAVISHIKDVLAADTKPSGTLGYYFEECKKVDPAGWDYALEAPGQCPNKHRDSRAVALEMARLWFTQVLKDSTPNPINIYLPKTTKWRLYPDVATIKVKDNSLLKWLGLRVTTSLDE